MKLTKSSEQRLLAGEVNDKDSPLYTEHGATYLKYDELQIENSDNGVLTTFLFRGKPVATMYVAGPRFVDTQILHLSGIEGRVEIKVTN